MSSEAHEAAFGALAIAANVLTLNVDTFADLIRAERDSHNSLHITDPTLYHATINSKSLAQQVRLAKAALAFVLEVQKVKSELSAAPIK